MLIAIEGIDASGKHTMSNRLAEKLHGRVYSFPNYKSPMGELIKDHLAGQWHAQPEGMLPLSAKGELLDPMVFQALQLANRMEIARELVEEAGRRDVVLDRYWMSGYAYGVHDGIDGEYLIKLHEFLPQPDLCILLDVDPKDSQARRPERRDRYERDATTMLDAADNYRALWTRMARGPVNIGFCKLPQRWVVVDARQDPEQVFRDIWDAYLMQHNYVAR